MDRLNKTSNWPRNGRGWQKTAGQNKGSPLISAQPVLSRVGVRFIIILKMGFTTKR
jgi:hypothetical protein